MSAPSNAWAGLSGYEPPAAAWSARGTNHGGGDRRRRSLGRGGGKRGRSQGAAASRLAGIPMTMRTLREQDTVWQARAGRSLPDCSMLNAVDAIYLRPLGGRRFVLGRGFPRPYLDCDPEN